MLRSRPYFAASNSLRTSLTGEETAARIRELAAEAHLKGAVDGNQFWLRGGPGWGGLYPYGVGEIESGAGQTSVSFSLGMRPLVYAIEAALAVAVALWTVAAVFARLLHDAGVLPDTGSWRPYAGLAAVILVLVGIIRGHRLGNQAKAALRERLQTAIGADPL